MASTIEDAEAAAERLEAALERIARLAVRPTAEGGPTDTEMPAGEIRERLDRMIARLRTALDAQS